MSPVIHGLVEAIWEVGDKAGDEDNELNSASGWQRCATRLIEIEIALPNENSQHHEECYNAKKQEIPEYLPLNSSNPAPALH